MTGHEDAALKAATDVLFEEVNPPGVRQQHSHRVVTDMARRMLAAARPHLEAAAAAAERERLLSSTQVRLADEALSMDRLGRADMTLDEAAGQIGTLVASVRMLLDLLRSQLTTGRDPR